MEWKAGKPGLVGQVDSWNTLVYPPRNQRFRALLRGGAHALRIGARASLMRQTQRMKNQCCGFIEGVIGPMAVKDACAAQTASTTVDQIPNGDASTSVG